MAKILILGNSGSGKSTFGRQLANVLHYDILFLDKFTYETSWDKPNFKAMEEKVAEYLKKDNYIIDGNFIDHFTNRYEDCDTIFFLDVNRFTCLSSVLERKRMYKGKTRESRNDNCDERITKDYLKWVFFDFYKTSRKRILNILKDNNNKKVIILKTRKEMRSYINELTKQHFEEGIKL